MRKEFKIYGWGWVILIALLIIYLIVPSHHDLAEDPKNIEKIIKIDLPDIAKTESSYYRDPPAPSLDVYTHDITFVEKLSKECIKELEERCHTSVYWEKLTEQDCYLYKYEIGYHYSVHCYVYKDYCSIRYAADTNEGVSFWFYWIIGFLIVNTYGFIIFIIWLICKIWVRIKKRNSAENLSL